ncbi:MAG: ABC transporter ATP-binding protein [Proteobacteria bacterium]|nr:ABC transporter ATP-binding protein [Pseudomonadota bacterium]
MSKRYGNAEVLSNVSLGIDPGSFVTLLGPSGCGKTTLLRLIAGFIESDGGRIRIDGRDMTGLAPQQRPIGMVFQNLALFPHFSVAENVAYGLKLRRLEAREIASKVERFLDLVDLAGLGDRRISQLSGGQKQRVALARSLVLEPSILLLDEPLSALDLQLRKQLQVGLKDIQKALRTTFVFVTHDQEEATLMSDKVVVMSAGRIQQAGAPHDIYVSPENLFVAKFIGDLNEIPARIAAVSDGRMALESALGHIEVPRAAARGFEPVQGKACSLCLRPEMLEAKPASALPAGGAVQVKAQVVDRFAVAGATRLLLTCGEQRLSTVAMTHAAAYLPAPGEICQVSFDPGHVQVFEPLGADMAKAFGERA